jgi:hypothetical protein
MTASASPLLRRSALRKTQIPGPERTSDDDVDGVSDDDVDGVSDVDNDDGNKNGIDKENGHLNGSSQVGSCWFKS